MFQKALITAWDLLAPPDEPLTLEAVVERNILPFIDPAIEGAIVEVAGVGTASTDRTGRAAFSLGPRRPGTHRFAVRLTGERLRAAPDEALVQVIHRDQPIFVTDIDRTIADVSALAFPFLSNQTIRPLEGSVEALERIAERMTVVYLTARDHIFTAKTKSWLARYGFPEGPLYARRRRFWSVSPRRHKLERLAELRAWFPAIAWGLGDLAGDAHAYAAHSIRPILLSPRPLRGVPPGTLTVGSWKEVLPAVLRRT